MTKRATAKLTAREMEETKEHILAAGRELLLAAHGALKFCQSYAEHSAPTASKPNVAGFFQKALAVAHHSRHAVVFGGRRRLHDGHAAGAFNRPYAQGTVAAGS